MRKAKLRPAKKGPPMSDETKAKLRARDAERRRKVVLLKDVAASQVFFRSQAALGEIAPADPDGLGPQHLCYLLRPAKGQVEALAMNWPASRRRLTPADPNIPARDVWVFEYRAVHDLLRQLGVTNPNKYLRRLSDAYWTNVAECDFAGDASPGGGVTA